MASPMTEQFSVEYDIPRRERIRPEQKISTIIMGRYDTFCDAQDAQTKAMQNPLVLSARIVRHTRSFEIIDEVSKCICGSDRPHLETCPFAAVS